MRWPGGTLKFQKGGACQGDAKASARATCGSSRSRYRIRPGGKVRSGGVWDEEHEGTNGIGTCLVEKRPLTIDRDQHFLSRNILLSCTAAPIYDQDANLAGVLDVSSCRADRSAGGFADLIALAVTEAARRIEADIFRTVFATSRILLVPVTDGQGGALLAIDADDLVIGATRSARLALGLATERAFRPVPAADLLGGAARRSTISAKSSAVCCSVRCYGPREMCLPRRRRSASAAPHSTAN